MEGPEHVRSKTAVLTRGFDPRLSVGSARPAVFRSSTYVFESPEAAERAFAIVHGKEQAAPHERGPVPPCFLSAANRPALTIAVSEKRRREAGDTEAAEP